MSDTPRTDAITTHWNLSLENMNRRGGVLLDLSRQLERDLAAATERAEQAEKRVKELSAWRNAVYNLREAALPFCDIEVNANYSYGEVSPAQVNRLRELCLQQS